MISPPNLEQLPFLNLIYGYWKESAKWPKRTRVAAALRKQKGLDLARILDSLPFNLALPDYGEADGLKLSVVANSKCPKTEKFIQAFVDFQRLAAKRFIEGLHIFSDVVATEGREDHERKH